MTTHHELANPSALDMRVACTECPTREDVLRVLPIGEPAAVSAWNRRAARVRLERALGLCLWMGLAAVLVICGR